MRNIDEILGFRNVMNLQTPKIEVGAPIAKKYATNLGRLSKANLGQMYFTSPIIFNSINKNTQIITSTEFKFEGNPKSVEFLNEFVNNIGTSGNELDWDLFKIMMFKYLQIYGECPIEPIRTLDGKKIVDLDIINPEIFDYALNQSSHVALDEYNNPLGYTVTYPWAVTVTSPFPAPEGVVLRSDQAFIPPDRIAHLKLYTLGDGLYPIGLLEPIYQTEKRRKDSEEGYANASHRVGNPIVDIDVGDELHEPTEDQLKQALDLTKDMNSRQSLAHPYYVKMSLLESKNPERQRSFLDYYIEQEVTSMGLPTEFALGGGENINRGALLRREYIYKLTLRDIINRALRTLNSKVFSKILEQNELLPAHLVAEEVVLEELDARAKRLVNYAKAGLLEKTPKVEEYIMKSEGLEQEEKK